MAKRGVDGAAGLVGDTTEPTGRDAVGEETTLGVGGFPGAGRAGGDGVRGGVTGAGPLGADGAGGAGAGDGLTDGVGVEAGGFADGVDGEASGLVEGACAVADGLTGAVGVGGSAGGFTGVGGRVGALVPGPMPRRWRSVARGWPPRSNRPSCQPETTARTPNRPPTTATPTQALR